MRERKAFVKQPNHERQYLRGRRTNQDWQANDARVSPISLPSVKYIFSIPLILLVN